MSVSAVLSYCKAVHPSVAIREGPFGLGGFAAEEIPPGSELFLLPYDNILSERYALESAFGKAVMEGLRAKGVKDADLPAPRILLYLVALHERSFESASSSASASEAPKFSAYLRSLPSSFDDVLHWSPEELALLKGVNIVEARDQKMTWLQREHARLPRDLLLLLSPKADFSFASFLWAHSAFASRAFPHILSEPPSSSTSSTGASEAVVSAAAAPIDKDAGFVGCMLPACDLLNHAYRTKITWQRKDGGLAFITEETIPKGSEVCNNYGPKSNEEFALFYGFALPGNPQDTFAVKVAFGGHGGGGGREDGEEDDDDDDNAGTSLLPRLMAAAGLKARHDCRRRKWRDGAYGAAETAQKKEKEEGTNGASSSFSSAAAPSTSQAAALTLYSDNVIAKELLAVLRLASQSPESLQSLMQLVPKGGGASTICAPLQEKLMQPLCYCSEVRALRSLRDLLHSKLQGLLAAHPWLTGSSLISSSGSSIHPYRAALAMEVAGGQVEVLCDALQVVDEGMAALPYWWHARLPQAADSSASSSTTVKLSASPAEGHNKDLLAIDFASEKRARYAVVLEPATSSSSPQVLPAGTPVLSAPFDAVFFHSLCLSRVPSEAFKKALRAGVDDGSGAPYRDSEESKFRHRLTKSEAISDDWLEGRMVSLALLLINEWSTLSRKKYKDGGSNLEPAESIRWSWLLWSRKIWCRSAFATDFGTDDDEAEEEAKTDVYGSDYDGPPSKRQKLDDKKDSDKDGAGASGATDARAAARKATRPAVASLPGAKTSKGALVMLAETENGDEDDEEEEDDDDESFLDFANEMFKEMVKPLVSSSPKQFKKKLFSKENFKWAMLVVKDFAVPLVMPVFGAGGAPLTHQRELVIFPLGPIPARPSLSASSSSSFSCDCSVDVMLTVSAQDKALSLVISRDLHFTDDSSGGVGRLAAPVHWNLEQKEECAAIGTGFASAVQASGRKSTSQWPPAMVDGETLRSTLMHEDKERKETLANRIKRATCAGPME